MACDRTRGLRALFFGLFLLLPLPYTSQTTATRHKKPRTLRKRLKRKVPACRVNPMSLQWCMFVCLFRIKRQGDRRGRSQATGHGSEDRGRSTCGFGSPNGNGARVGKRSDRGRQSGRANNHGQAAPGSCLSAPVKGPGCAVMAHPGLLSFGTTFQLLASAGQQKSGEARSATQGPEEPCRCLRGRPTSRRSNNASGSKRNTLATTPICQGMTR